MGHNKYFRQVASLVKRLEQGCGEMPKTVFSVVQSLPLKSVIEMKSGTLGGAA